MIDYYMITTGTPAKCLKFMTSAILSQHLWLGANLSVGVIRNSPLQADDSLTPQSLN